MDPKTIFHYDSTAPETAERYRAALNSSFATWRSKYLEKPSRVLEIGFGSGRDLRKLQEFGHQVLGVDASSGMLKEAAIHFPQLAPHLRLDSLPRLELLNEESFEVIIAIAVVMHVPLVDIAASLQRLCELLAPGGTMLLVVPAYSRTGSLGPARIPDGRLFNGLTPDEYQRKCEEQGLACLERSGWEDSLGRAGFEWSQLTFRKGYSGPH